MPGVDDVKTKPLVHRQGPENWVIQDLRRAKRLRGPDGRCVQAGQIPLHAFYHVGQGNRAGGHDVLGRRSALGKVTEVDERKGHDALLERALGGERRALLQAALQPFRRAGVGLLKVLDNLDRRPAVAGASRRCLGRDTTRAADDEVETGLQCAFMSSGRAMSEPPGHRKVA